jgi:hypothetical protein
LITNRRPVTRPFVTNQFLQMIGTGRKSSRQSRRFSFHGQGASGA